MSSARQVCFALVLTWLCITECSQHGSNLMSELHDTVRVECSVGTYNGKKKVLPNGQSVVQFLGVRYGEIPERFRRANPVSNPGTIFKATEFGSSCPQNAGSFSTNQTVHDQSEDCLFLNIYSPAIDPPKRLPVLVFVHGGTFIQGAGGDFDGSVLSTFRNIIVVTINYRVGVLGFMSSGSEELPGNLGLWDQTLAVKWVKDNIGQFGGDPDIITVAGQSAGSACVSFLVNSIQTAGLFSRAIMMSATVNSPWAFNPSPKPTFDTVVNFFSCHGNRSIADQIECLRKVPISKLVTPAYPNSFPIVRDGVFVTESPQDFMKMATNGQLSAERKNLLSRRQYLIGSTSQEGLLLYSALGQQVTNLTGLLSAVVPNYQQVSDRGKSVVSDKITELYGRQFDLSDERQAQLSGVKMYGDSFFVAPVLHMSDVLAKYSKQTYGYSFDLPWDPKTRKGPLYGSEADWFPDWLIKGTGHGDELYYLFGYPLNTEASLYRSHPKFINTDRKMARLMMSFFGNFMKKGNPNRGRTPVKDGYKRWPRFATKGGRFHNRVMILRGGRDSVKMFDFSYEESRLWNFDIPVLSATAN